MIRRPGLISDRSHRLARRRDRLIGFPRRDLAAGQRQHGGAQQGDDERAWIQRRQVPGLAMQSVPWIHCSFWFVVVLVVLLGLGLLWGLGLLLTTRGLPLLSLFALGLGLGLGLALDVCLEACAET